MTQKTITQGILIELTSLNEASEALKKYFVKKRLILIDEITILIWKR